MALERDRYQRLIESATEGIWTLDADDRIELANRRMCALLRCTSDDLSGRSVLELIDESDRESLQAALDRGRQGLEEKLDVRLRREDGTHSWVSVSAGPMYEGPRYTGTVCVIADASERKRLHSIFANSLDAILLMNDRGFFVDANPSAESLFGYSLSELTRLHFTAITPPPSDGEAEELWKLLLASGRQYGEFRVRRKDGGLIQIEYCAVVGIQPGIHLVMARDVSARKRAEASLAESMTRLELLSERLVRAQEDERGRIARELHDDVGQTMTAVALGLEAARRTCTCGAGDSRQIQKVREDVERVMKQIREIGFGLRPLVLDDLGLPAALRSYLDALAQRNGIPIHFSSTLPVVRLCSEVEIACFRIVQEALTNVLRHSSSTEVRVTLGSEGSWVALCIQDNGVGFDIDSVAPSTTSSGLGLIGMQERVRLLGGRIEIATSAGQGTRIEVAMECPSLAEIV